MNDNIIMIKKTMASICIACLVLGGCTEDTLLSDSQTPQSTETVTVKLSLGIDDYNGLSEGETRMQAMPPVLSMSSPEMDVELVATPAATRAASSPSATITEDNAVYSYMGFQFDGTTPEGILVEKAFFTSPDGSIKTDSVKIKPTEKNKKNMFVVLANVNEDDFESIKDGSTYAELQRLCMTLASSNKVFPRNTVKLPNGGEVGIVMCGQVAAEINDGKQLFISLKRTVAKVTFNIKTTYTHFTDVAHTWNVTLMNIPTQNYYNIIGRKAIFPSESSMDKTGLFWSKSLITETTKNPNFTAGPLYIPINLQQPVLTSTQSTRRDNAPIGGTYLQIMGVEKNSVGGTEDLDIINDFSIYQIFLGKNFTTDFSVYANYDLTYNITLKGNSPDDTNVVRLIPGYFSGELMAYGDQGILGPASAENASNAVKWQYPHRIELHFMDGYYPKGSSSATMPGVKDLKWYAETGTFSNYGAVSLTDGSTNTLALQAINVPWEDYAAAYTCFRGTNGFNQGYQPTSDKAWWYLPSVSELIGTWISSSTTQKQLAKSGYWSSTANPNADEAFAVTNEGKVYSDDVRNQHAVRAAQDPDKASHASDTDSK